MIRRRAMQWGMFTAGRASTRVSGREIRLRRYNVESRETCSHCKAPCDKLKNCAKCTVSAKA